MREEVRRKVSESKKTRTSLWTEKGQSDTSPPNAARKGRTEGPNFMLPCIQIHTSITLFTICQLPLPYLMGPPKHFRHRRNTTKTTVETFGRDQQIARPNNAGPEGQKDKGAPAPPSRRCTPNQISQPHIGAHSSAVGDSHLPSWGRRSFTSGMVSRPSVGSGTKNK